MNKTGIIYVAASPANKGRKLTEEHKRKIGEANKGKIRSEESRKNMSEVHKGICVGELNPISKLTWNDVSKIRYEYNFNDQSIDYLAQEYKVSKSNIGLIIRNKTWKDKNYKRTRY